MRLLASKATPLIEHINTLVEEGYTSEEFSKVSREVESLAGKNQTVEYRSLAGMLSSLSGDAADTRKNYSAALAASGNSPTVLVNYANAMFNIGYFRESLELMGRALEKAGNDVETLLDALAIYVDLHYTSGMEQAMAKLDNLKVEHQIAGKEHVRLLAERGLDWDEIIDRLTMATTIAKCSGLGWCKGIGDEIDGVVTFDFIFKDVSLESLASLENSILEEIAKKPYRPIDDHLIFRCSHA